MGTLGDRHAYKREVWCYLQSLHGRSTSDAIAARLMALSRAVMEDERGSRIDLHTMRLALEAFARKDARPRRIFLGRAAAPA